MAVDLINSAKLNWNGGSKEDTVWEYSREARNDFHPTQKPVPIACRAITNSTEAGNIVLDLFLGSGTTMVACEQIGRVCYGIEIDPAYVAVTLERMSKMDITPELADGQT